MFRYFDFRVQQGKTYVYRLKLKLEDPNAPLDPRMHPSAVSLHVDVQKRLSEQKKAEPIRESELSEGSNPVRISKGSFLLAGPVKGAREYPVRGQMVKFRVGDPEAEVLAVEFDEINAAELPAKLSVKVGSLAYTKADVEPVQRWKEYLLKKKLHRFTINSVFLDIQGGIPLGLTDLTSPGEVLVWDDDGKQLRVLSELADEAEYPNYIFPPEQAQGEGDRFNGAGRGGEGREGRGEGRGRDR